MIVKELIEELSGVEPDRLVVLQKDAEGNGYALIRSVYTGKYRDGETGLERLTPELKEQGYSGEDVMRGGKKAVILAPE